MTPREAANVVVVAEQSRRRDEVLRLTGLDGAFRPHGRFAGQTKYLAYLSKWDDFGPTRAEQDAKIREMLDKQRTSVRGFLPHSRSWFTTGSAELADAKGRKLDAG